MTTRRPNHRPIRSAEWRNPDMVSVRANLVWLHGHTHEEEHEAVHLIAEGLGADKDWLHDAVRLEVEKVNQAWASRPHADTSARP